VNDRKIEKHAVHLLQENDFSAEANQMKRTERDIPITVRDPQIPEKIGERFAVLLDMNVWIDLTEGKAEEISRIREKLRSLVKRGTLFCPLAPTIIWELYRQSYTSSVKVAEVMEELSLNICFAPTEEIYIKEVDAVFEEICTGAKPVIGPDILFAPVSTLLGTRVALHFPNVSAFEDPQLLADHVARQLRATSIVELCRMTKNSFSQPKEQAPRYAETARRRKEIANESREKARRVEEEEVLGSIVTPRIIELGSLLPIHVQADLAERLRSLPKDNYDGAARHLISSMPSVNHRIDIFCLVGQDPLRKDKMQDFYDRELIMAPYVYSNVFVTRDKGIRYILEKLGGSQGKVFGKYEQFEKYLDSLQGG
jgi:hypothetical protein